MIERGYSTDDEQNKTVTISVRAIPYCIIFAIDGLIHNGISKSHAFIQRNAIYYAVSCLNFEISRISKNAIAIQNNELVQDLISKRESHPGLRYQCQVKVYKTSISLPFWCSEWIRTNSQYINLDIGTLTNYLLMFSFSKASINNLNVFSQLSLESKVFLEYLRSC